jgi:hypothetical protein
MPREEHIEAEPSPRGGVRRRLRICLANLAIALSWALKRSCKGCSHRLFTTARWLVPEVERFLVYRSGLDDHPRRIGTLLSQRQSYRVAAGFLIVLVLLGSLDLATRATAISTEPVLRNSPFHHQSLSASSDPTQEFDTQPASVPRFQDERVPLPTRKPRGVYNIPSEKGVNAVTKKRMVQQKSARKRMR